MLQNLLTPTYFMGVTPNGVVCEEFITLGKLDKAPMLVSGTPMYHG